MNAVWDAAVVGVASVDMCSDWIQPQPSSPPICAVDWDALYEYCVRGSEYFRWSRHEYDENFKDIAHYLSCEERMHASYISDMSLSVHHDYMLGAARTVVGAAEEAWDAVQDSLLKALRKLVEFRQEAQFSTWMYRVTINCTHDVQRRVRSRSQQETLLIDDPHASPSWERAASYDPLHAHATRMTVRSALSLLPDSQRQALELTDLSGYPISAVASVLGVAQGTVKSRRWRARSVLHEELVAVYE